MHALLFTSSILEEDFTLLIKKGNHANPSNQHFYQSFAKMLSLIGPLDVISYRPLTILKGHYLKEINKTSENMHYHYLPFLNLPKIKSFQIAHYSLRKIKKWLHSDTIIFVDSLNIALIQLAFRTAKKYHLPIVGVITDHPKNITGVSKKYIQTIESYFSKYDLYYALTDGLNQTTNPLHHPCFIKEGLIDDTISFSPTLKKDTPPYIFFGGALYEKYGISNLLKAFHRYESSCHLILAGQGPSVPLIEEYMKKDARIHYVGLLSKEEMLCYEQNALLNINPRPLNKELEALSFPSKILEYIHSGTPTMTTENEIISRNFFDNLFYIGTGTEEEIYQGFVHFFSLSKKEQEQKAKKARELALAHYSLSVVAEEFASFIKECNSSSSFLDNIER